VGTKHINTYDIAGWVGCEVAPTRISPSKEFQAIESLLDRVRLTGANEKVRNLQEAARLIRQMGASTDIVDRVIRRLIAERRSDGLDDAIDILTLLGGSVVDSVVKSSLSTYPPTTGNEDYWYALIRASGKTRNRNISESFLSSPILALEEAAVQALAEIGDTSAIASLRRVAATPSEPQLIRELAAELLTDFA
jgi:hypothetical protein